MKRTTTVGHSKLGDDSAVMVRRLATAALLATMALLPKDADACGACYASNNESTVVNDHKMALSISRQQTILWDQISYSGNPTNFAYVLPAKPGTRLEPSNDAWFNALDVSTRPLIMPPASTNNGGFGYEGDFSEEGSGCACNNPLGSTAADRASGGNAAPPSANVQVVEEAVVGPYETVTVRSADADALRLWLVDHGYAIPDNSAPIIAEYVHAGFDFIALRLQPRQTERQIEPIRIVSPGPDPNLPLRLMQIGAASKVGITLYVISEGRYHTASFPDAVLDKDKLVWDLAQSRSNYQELAQRAMEASEGKAFLTEYAKHPDLDTVTAPPLTTGASMTGNPGLAAAYQQLCGVLVEPRPHDAGADNGSGGELDGGPDSGGSSDAGDGDAGGMSNDDAGSGETYGDAGQPKQVRTALCDDLSSAIAGLNPADIWVTRLRANLPNSALAATLVLEPAQPQEIYENVYQTTSTGSVTQTASVSPSRARGRHGTFALIGLTALVVSKLVRRRRAR